MTDRNTSDSQERTTTDKELLLSVGRRSAAERLDALRQRFGRVQRSRPSASALPEATFEEAKDGPVFVARGRFSAKASWQKHPSPNGGFGMVGKQSIQVTSKTSFLDGFLLAPFKLKALGYVDVKTIHFFRFHEKRGTLHLVHDAHVDAKRGVVAARIASPGNYVIAGLNRHPLVTETFKLVCGARDYLRQVPQREAERFHQKLCELIICAPEWKSGRDTPFDPVAMDAGTLQNLCDTCHGIPTMTLPELPGCQVVERPCREGAWESLGPHEITGSSGETFNRGIGCIKEIVFTSAPQRRQMFASTEHGGVWALDDIDQYSDVRWRPLSDQLPGLQMRALATAPSDRTVLYAANSLGRVYRSVAGTSQWTETSTTDFGFVRRILVHDSSPDTLWVAANSGFFLTTDAGANWAPLLDPATFSSTDVLDAAIDPEDSSILYIGVRGLGVFKSFTAGQSWNQILDFARATQQNLKMIRLSLGVRNADGSDQTDATRTVAAKLGREVFVSPDGGATFVSKGLRGLNGGHRLRSDGQNFTGEWCNAIAVDPHDPSIILAGQQDLFKTTDGGDKWRRISGNEGDQNDGLGNPTRLIHEDVQHIVFHPERQGLAFIANDGGLYRYRDARHEGWSEDDTVQERFDELFNGLAVSEFFRVGVRASSAVGNLDHNGLKGTLNLESGIWEKPNQSGGNNALEFSYVYADPRREGRFYVFRRFPQNRGALFRLRYPAQSDEPLNEFIRYGDFKPYTMGFNSLPTGPLAVDTRSDSNAVLVCADTDTDTGTTNFRLMMTREANLEPTVDGAGNPTGLPTWQAAFDNGSSDPMVGVIFAPSSPGTAYAISDSGKTIRKGDVNQGAISDGWQEPGTWGVSDVRQLAVNLEDVNRLYAITGTQLGRSEDGGAKWVEFGQGLPSSEFNSLVVHPTDPHTLFLGADIGVFVSYNDGENWSIFDVGLPNAEVVQVLVVGRHLFAVTHGRGLWRRRVC